ncbi:sugar phosphate isomerase/epimerase family protein [Thermoflexibacter ruber]|uniref:Sugar phosphate isomerase/epimerase n=1 Tax=Thermoflexibacter ruber TaxID=1003 RepID=A0A1I2HS45_9BACT|nr:sugar phosphate isomerase/epimerase [Thermoflexibacter ruber]SFF32944.1 Sugar phosphate isomerase/epimerase [Thermoflexibacter ruber]
MENRRTFLKKSLVGATAMALLPQAMQAARIKTQGVQLYTVRSDMDKDPTATLQKVAAIGYKEVELAGYREGKFYGKTPAEFRKLLGDNGLKAISGHVSTAVLKNGLNEMIEASATIGQKFIVCPFTAPQERKSLDDFKTLVELFSKTGEACKKAGIQFAYHNHAFEFDLVEGQMLFDYLLQNIPNDLMTMEMDIFWTVKAGQDPVAYFEKYPNRFALWHVKDMDKTEKKEFTEVGQGVIDFKKIFQNAGKAGMKHFFVEQDVCKRPPLESIKMSFDYLKKLKY